MGEAQNLSINLDSKSISILKKVDASFRDTIVNIGLRMVENTELFITLTGESKNIPVEDMTSLDSLESNTDNKPKTTKKETKEETKHKPKTTWDSF